MRKQFKDLILCLILMFYSSISQFSWPVTNRKQSTGQRQPHRTQVSSSVLSNRASS